MQPDGIITRKEYEKIKKCNIFAPQKPQNLMASVKDNTVILTWSKVPGAVCYEISRGNLLLGTVSDETTWTDKNAPTGTSVQYSVTAKKYTVSGISASTMVQVPIYYQKVTISELKKNHKNYIGKYVELRNVKFDGWRIRTSTGKYSRDFSKISSLKNGTYDLCILGKDSSGMVELRLSNIGNWNMNGGDVVEYCYKNRVSTVSGKGIVREETTDWYEVEFGSLVDISYYENTKKVPVIELDDFNWSNK